MSTLLAAAPALLLAPRRDAGVPEDLAAHLERYGGRPVATGAAGAALIRTLDGIALAGRGGAHFPVAAKWRAVRDSGRPATVVANAAEGEPASAKDRTLLAHRPHLVLDGLFLAAEALRADEVVVWTHHDDHPTRRVLDRALRERVRAGWVEPPVRLATAPAGYLSGESSAIVRALSGGPVLPQFTRVPAAVRGVRGRPTLVQNVESLARVGLAARTGVAGHYPTVLLTVVLAGTRRVVEVAPERTVAEAVRLAGWPSTMDNPVAVLLGGYGGTWVPWRRWADLPVHEPALRAAGASLGAGIVVPLPAGACALAEVAAVAGYLADSGAGQCGPCRYGLPAIARILKALAAGRAARRDLDRMAGYLQEVRGRGACHHPDGAVRFVTSALATFEAEVAAHLRGSACATGRHPRLLPIPGGSRGTR